MTVNQTNPEIFYVPATPHSPNSTLPVVVYRNVLVDRTSEDAIKLLKENQWIKGGHWKIANETLAATPHYHATTHEAYTVLQGTGTYMLGKSPLDPETHDNGKPTGVKFVARPGDVFAWPAGVTHYVTATEDDYEIIGFYGLTGFNSLEEPYDMEYALDSVEETERKRERCERVPGPEFDPVYGKEGPMPRLWNRSWKKDHYKAKL
ncbi:cupin domain protein [Colletotrichum truncatum]|uniref:Cupin domain protein n=1 Tax=Colletotrichum truncatum TaxID=5467 RepID=A0ACC3YHT0_COLTU|nr:cupin domain protein [Colletotrichum truncatum]KAF6785986.1 cupin domain protein [Colletotrichum truncatum]